MRNDAQTHARRQFQNTLLRGWSSYTYHLPSTENHPYHPAISDMTFWQLQNELDELNRKLSLPPTRTKRTGKPIRRNSLKPGNNGKT